MQNGQDGLGDRVTGPSETGPSQTGPSDTGPGDATSPADTGATVSTEATAGQSVAPAATQWNTTAKITAVLAVLVLLVGGLLGWLIYSTSAAQAAENARGEAPAAAAEQVKLIFGYDHTTIREQLDTALEGVTGDFRDTFEDEFSTTVIPRAEEKQVVSTATVVAQGAVETTKDSATVLVYVNQTVNANTGPKATFTPSRLLVEMSKVDGRWMLSGLEAV